MGLGTRKSDATRHCFKKSKGPKIRIEAEKWAIKCEGRKNINKK